MRPPISPLRSVFWTEVVQVISKRLGTKQVTSSNILNFEKVVVLPVRHWQDIYFDPSTCAQYDVILGLTGDVKVIWAFDKLRPLAK